MYIQTLLTTALLIISLSGRCPRPAQCEAIRMRSDTQMHIKMYLN